MEFPSCSVSTIIRFLVFYYIYKRKVIHSLFILHNLFTCLHNLQVKAYTAKPNCIKLLALFFNVGLRRQCFSHVMFLLFVYFIASCVSLFPAQFGQWAFGPQHGFARVARWHVEKLPERLASGDVEAIFSLMDDDFTRSMWHFQSVQLI